MRESGVTDSKRKFAWSETKTWAVIAVLSIIWWLVVAHRDWQRFVLTASVSLASFIIGSLAGFLFTSYGEETSTVGKVRDWLIGAITGLTIAKATGIKSLLVLFAAGPGPTEYAFVVANAIMYSGIGFYFMFFQRELIFNVLLAQTRAERLKLEGSQQVTTVLQQLLVKLPVSVLSGIEYLDETDLDASESQELRELLYSDDVEKFLTQAESAARSGQLDWDIASKTANIHYYRSYFAEKNRSAEIKRATEWVLRALNMNPFYADLTMKYADLLASDEDYEGAAAILERMLPEPQTPMVVRQWIGFYLRYVPQRLDDSITYSKQYHQWFQAETDSLFNIAYALAGKYKEELRKEQLSENLESENRKEALSILKEALADQPQMVRIIESRWLTPGRPFAVLAKDPEFVAILTSAKEANKADGESGTA